MIASPVLCKAMIASPVLCKAMIASPVLCFLRSCSTPTLLHYSALPSGLPFPIPFCTFSVNARLLPSRLTNDWLHSTPWYTYIHTSKCASWIPTFPGDDVYTSIDISHSYCLHCNFLHFSQTILNLHARESFLFHHAVRCTKCMCTMIPWLCAVWYTIIAVTSSYLLATYDSDDFRLTET